MTETSRPTRTMVDDPKATDALLQALRGRVRGRTELVKLTHADAVALTGMPSEQAEPALKSLVKTYRSHLAVTEEGELIYAFDPSLERRDAVPLRERLAGAGRLVWRGFKVLFKVWIVVTLVVYVVAFLLMMLALLFARNGGDDRDDRRGGGGGFPMLWWFLMPDLAPRGHGGWGRQRRVGPPPKRFYLAVFDFVFGPNQAPVDPRESDRRLIGYLRDHRGRITATDLVALTGLSYDAADEELTRLTVEYDGEVEVAEEGTLVYAFPDMLKSAELGAGRWSFAWDRPQTVPPLTGNTSGANTVISLFNGFNLLAALTIGPSFLLRAGLYGDPTLRFLVTAFPLMFSAIFFAVPAVRALRQRGRNRRATRRKLRHALLREIWTHPESRFDPGQLAGNAARQVGVEPAQAQACLDRLLAELEGDVDTDAEGRLRYRFPRIAEEQVVAGRARLAAGDEGQLGEVIFSSDDAEVH